MMYMKIWKKNVVTTLVALFSLSATIAISACGKRGEEEDPDTPLVRSDIVTDNNVYPIVKEQYVNQFTFKMMSHSNINLMADWSENYFFKRMEALTGVKMDFTKVYDDSTYGEKFSLVFLDEDTMPDFFYKALITRQNELKFGSEGLLIKLEKYIDEYCPNLKARMEENPMIRKVITSADGHIYALPTIHYKGDNSNTADGYYFINKKWCEKIGVDPNSITTIERLREVLTEFKNRDMNDDGSTTDECPMYLAGSTELYYLFGTFGYSVLGWNSYVDENGQVKVAAQEDKYKEMLKYFNGMYASNLINQDYLTRTTSHKWVQLKNNKIGCFMDYSTEVAGDYANDFVALPAMNSSTYYTGQAFYPGRLGVDPGAFAITSKCEHPEVLMRWIDTMYDIDYSRWDTIGKEGEEWKWDDDAHTSWSFLVDVNVINYERAIQFGGGLPGVEMTYDGFMLKSSDPVIQHSYNEIAKIQPKIKIGIPNMSMPEKTTKTLSTSASAISIYLGNLISSAVAGTVNLDSEWENVQKKLRSMGVVKYIDTLQEEVDKFYAR